MRKGQHCGGEATIAQPRKAIEDEWIEGTAILRYFIALGPQL
jgi:hypothetical protein